MAGTIPLSMTQQFDLYGKPLAGAQLFIIQAGTVSTPQDAFQDTNLTIKQPYPMTLDQAGRVPQFFLADGTVKLRLQDVSGVVQLASDSVLVIGPSAGGGGGGASVDPTQLIQTGNMILRYGVGVLAGYVRMNGLSIGSATSGATERANLDCQNAFLYLYGADPNLVVSGGRTNAAADWAANKQLFLPDYRGYNISALDDMGNVPANRLLAYFANATVLGAAGGVPYSQLSATNLPPYTPAGTIAGVIPPVPVFWRSNPGGSGGGQFTDTVQADNSGGVNHSFNLSPSFSGSFTGSPAPGWNQTPFAMISPRKLCTIYLKL